MSSRYRGTLPLLLCSLICSAPLHAQVADTPRVQRPIPTLTRPPLQVRDSIRVPSVIGQTVPVAVRTLIAAGIRPVTVDSAPAPAPTPGGTVVAQRPGAGQTVPRGSAGTVFVGVVPPAAPPPPQLVPSVVGMTLGEAARALAEEKLRLGGVDTVPRAGGSGRVVAQSPRAGSTIPRDRAVALTVTIAPPTLLMPELRGTSLARARALVGARGLVLASVDSVARAGGDGTVVDQRPAAGATVRAGEAVSLLLAVPAPPAPATPPVVATAPPPAAPPPAAPPPAAPPPAAPPPSTGVTPATPPQGASPVTPPPTEPPLPQPTAAPVTPTTPAPITPAPAAAAQVDTVLVRTEEPAGAVLPWILLGLLLGALLTAAALLGRQTLSTRRERAALRAALQAGPPTVRIAPKRHPDRQELRLPGPLFSGPAIRILPHRDAGEIRLVMHPPPPAPGDKP